MTHVQIDDDFFDHPKVLSVGKDAKILSLAAICYAGNMLTDGFIPSGAVLVLAAKTGVRNAKPSIDELIAARLWETTEGGYLVHDYLDYNASAEKVRAKQAAARERMQRLRSPDVRANNERSSPEVREPTTTTTTTTERSYEPNGSSERKDSPQPPQSDPYSAEFSEFWNVYPKKKNKDDAWRAWKGRKDRPLIAVILASVSEHKESADWIKDGGQFIPNPATWIRAGAWKDEVQKAPEMVDPTEAYMRGEITSPEQLLNFRRLAS